MWQKKLDNDSSYQEILKRDFPSKISTEKQIEWQIKHVRVDSQPASCRSRYWSEDHSCRSVSRSALERRQSCPNLSKTFHTLYYIKVYQTLHVTFNNHISREDKAIIDVCRSVCRTDWGLNFSFCTCIGHDPTSPRTENRSHRSKSKVREGWVLTGSDNSTL